MQQSRFRDFAEQQAATRELHSRLRDGSHADAVTALDNFLVDAVSDWDAQFAISTVDDAERVVSTWYMLLLLFGVFFLL